MIVVGLKFECLIYTGTAVSIMQDDVRRCLRKVLTRYEGKILRSALSGIIPALAQCTARESFEQRVSPAEFIVLLSRPHKVIIGCDFVSALDAVIHSPCGEILISEFSISEDSLPSDEGLCCSDVYIFTPDSAVVITLKSTEP